MKQLKLILGGIAVFLGIFFNSCSIVGGIFQAGWTLGIFFAVVVILAFVLMIMRIRKK